MTGAQFPPYGHRGEDPDAPSAAELGLTGAQQDAAGETWQWKADLVSIRDALLTVAFLNEDEYADWLDHPGLFVSVQDWANSLGDLAHGLFVPLNALAREAADLRRANEALREALEFAWPFLPKPKAGDGYPDKYRDAYEKHRAALAAHDAAKGDGA